MSNAGRYVRHIAFPYGFGFVTDGHLAVTTQHEHTHVVRFMDMRFFAFTHLNEMHAGALALAHKTNPDVLTRANRMHRERRRQFLAVNRGVVVSKNSVRMGAAVPA